MNRSEVKSSKLDSQEGIESIIPSSNHPVATLNALKIKKIAQEGKQIIDLAMINPDIAPPRDLIDKLVQESLKLQHHRYSVSRGIERLRIAFAQKYQRAFGVTLSAQHDICVTEGSKEAIAKILDASADVSETVLVGTPVYPNYLSAAKRSKLKVVTFCLDGDQESITKDILLKLQQNPECRCLLLNLPNNPTGAILSREYLQEIVDCMDKRNGIVINDFVYGDLGYGGSEIPSILSLHAQNAALIETYSLSKVYSVPGWRVGALLGKGLQARKLIADVARHKSQTDYGIFTPIQLAAVYALDNCDVFIGEASAEYRRRVSLLAKGLRRFGWSVKPVLGGVSIWAKLPEEILPELDSNQFAKILLEECAIHVMPGELFGPEWSRYVRFAVVSNEERIRAALKVIEEWLDSKRI